MVRVKKKFLSLTFTLLPDSETWEVHRKGCLVATITLSANATIGELVDALIEQNNNTDIPF